MLADNRPRLVVKSNKAGYNMTCYYCHKNGHKEGLSRSQEISRYTEPE